jgi:zinc protease
MEKSMTFAMRVLIAAAALVAAVGAPAVAQSPDPWLTQQLEPVFHAPPADVEILTLDNGLQVVLMPNAAQPMVGVYCQVKVGSAWEDFATSGMSHMLEHLLFNGTDKYTQEELYARADRAGAYNNAHTTDFYTDFMMVLPADSLETGLDLQSQMLFHSLIPAEKFGKEQGIVLGELAQARDRGDRYFDETLRELLYRGTSLQLPTLGTTSTIVGMQRDDVYAFYRRWYVPNNMILTVAGGFDRDRALELVEQYYGQVAPRSTGEVRLKPALPLDTTVSVSRRGGGRRMVAMAFEAPSYDSPDYLAFEMATELLGAEGSGILTRALEDLPVEERPELGLWWQRAPGFSRLVLEFEMPAALDPTALYSLVQTALAGALEIGVSPDDLAEIMAMRRTGTLKEREQLRMTGIYIAEPMVLGGPDFTVTYLQRLAAVTSDDVGRVLRTWLVDRPCLAVLVEPATGVDDAGGDGPGPGTTIDRSVLDGGAVLVSQTDPSGELMAIHVTVRGRAQLDQRYGKAGALNLVHRVLEYGISGCDQACLAGRLRRLGAQIKLVDDPRFPMDDYYTTGEFSFIRIECPADSGPEIMDLLGEVARYSAFTRDDFEAERDDQVALLQRREGSAGARARALLRETLYAGHPLALAPEGTGDVVAEVSYDEARSMYRAAFAPENLVLAVVSPYTHEEIKDMLPSLGGGVGKPAEGLPPLPLTAAPEKVEDHLGGPMSSIRVGAVRQVDPADGPALELLVAVLSDRLAMDLRETRGLSYMVGAGIGLSGDRAVFTAQVNPPTARAQEGEQALADALRMFDAGTITQDELDTIRNARQGRLLMRRLDSISRAYYLAMAELDGDVFSYLREIPAYDDVTLEDLQRVSSFFSELPLVTVVVD